MSTHVLWPLEEHTKGKHAVLKSYLDAWLPILSRFHGRVLFIDGFSGPGRYEGGEEGSPLIALRCVREHTAGALMKEVVCIFIEADEDRADHLKALLAELTSEGGCPDKCKIIVTHGKFDEHLAGVLDYLDEQNKKLAPAFVMIDPFGVSDTPMSVMERLFKNERIEVYISLMYEWINRFKATPEFEPHMDRLFGTRDWRVGIAIEDGQARKDYFLGLYETRLRQSGAKYVLRFELYSGNRLKYAIFFGTKHPRGVDKMKQAIWKIAPTGDYAFHGSRARQLTLGMIAPDFRPLEEAVSEFLKSKPPGVWVKIPDIEEFVIACTDYHSSQYKANALKPLERAGKIEVDDTSRNKKGTYPPTTRLRWRDRESGVFLCPSCGERSLKFGDGDPVCSSCGWSDSAEATADSYAHSRYPSWKDPKNGPEDEIGTCEYCGYSAVAPLHESDMVGEVKQKLRALRVAMDLEPGAGDAGFGFCFCCGEVSYGKPRRDESEW